MIKKDEKHRVRVSEELYDALQRGKEAENYVGSTNGFIEHILTSYVQRKFEPTTDIKHNTDFSMEQYVSFANEISKKLSKIEGLILGKAAAEARPNTSQENTNPDALVRATKIRRIRKSGANEQQKAG